MDVLGGMTKNDRLAGLCLASCHAWSLLLLVEITGSLVVDWLGGLARRFARANSASCLFCSGAVLFLQRPPAPVTWLPKAVEPAF